MKTTALLIVAFFLALTVNAQIQLVKYVGKDSKKFAMGYGGSLKVAHSFNDIDDITAEIGANIINEKKEGSRFGIFTVPLKLGYRFKISRSATGLYVEPQAGYNLFGAHSYYSQTELKTVDKDLKGILISPGIGYLFGNLGDVQFNLEARYDINFVKGGSYNFLVFRLSHNFSFGKKSSDE
ncbi:MAG: hypothetical protein JWQ27_402 [Ferruginibacter sp.]|nr:hypothetical protein [Ferruginibacter sp.]